MAVARYASRRRWLSRKELLTGLAFGLLIVATIIIGMYLGIWLLKKEEEQEQALPPGSLLLDNSALSVAALTCDLLWND